MERSGIEYGMMQRHSLSGWGDHIPPTTYETILSAVAYLVPQSLFTPPGELASQEVSLEICFSETPPCAHGAPSTDHNWSVQAAQGQTVLRLLGISPFSWSGEGTLMEPV